MEKQKLKEELKQAAEKEAAQCSEEILKILTERDCKLAAYGVMEVEGKEYLVPVAELLNMKLIIKPVSNG